MKTLFKNFEVPRGNSRVQTSFGQHAADRLHFPRVKTLAQPRSRIRNSEATDGQYYDPWGNTLRVRIDGNYDNQVTNPYTATLEGWSDPFLGVIALVARKDQSGGTDGDHADKNCRRSSDDVISWQ